jgi:hypothetical protein
MKFILPLIVIASLTPVTALAQTNASNSSGANVTSYGGVSGSIWNGNRAPVITESEVGTKVFIADEPKAPVFDLGQPVPEQKLIRPVACGDDHAPCPTKKKVTYPKSKVAPRGRG